MGSLERQFLVNTGKHVFEEYSRLRIYRLRESQERQPGACLWLVLKYQTNELESYLVARQEVMAVFQLGVCCGQSCNLGGCIWWIWAGRLQNRRDFELGDVVGYQVDWVGGLHQGAAHGDEKEEMGAKDTKRVEPIHLQIDWMWGVKERKHQR